MIDKARLAQWRPSVPGIEVRTTLGEGGWVLEQRMEDGAIFSEILPVPPEADHLQAQIAELQSLNTCAPPILQEKPNKEEGVFIDELGWWSAWLPCRRCGGFRWRLPLRWRDLPGSRGTLEREMARLLGYRAVIVFGHERDEEFCPGCFDLRLDEGEAELEQFVWFSARHQDWHVRLLIGPELAIDLPVGLPSWADRDEVQSEARRLAEQFGPKPFDWEEDF